MSSRQWRRQVRRPSSVAVPNRVVPDLPDLLRGCPYLGNELATDARAFAHGLLPRIGSDRSECCVLRDALMVIANDSECNNFARVADAFRAVANTFVFMDPDPNISALRCDYYAATLGCRQSAWRVAGECLTLAHEITSSEHEALIYAAAAVHWLSFGSHLIARPQAQGRANPTNWEDVRAGAIDLGQCMVKRVLEIRRRLVAEAIASTGRTTGLFPTEAGVFVLRHRIRRRGLGTPSCS